MSTASSNMSEKQVLVAENELGRLAMRYRATKDESERNEIVQKYARVIEQLASSGRWQEVPPFEDQLPDAVMPECFAQYWSKRI